MREGALVRGDASASQITELGRLSNSIGSNKGHKAGFSLVWRFFAEVSGKRKGGDVRSGSTAESPGKRILQSALTISHYESQSRGAQARLPPIEPVEEAKKIGGTRRVPC